MSYRFIRRHEQAYAVGRMCTLLRICHSSYYAWKKRKPSQREQENQALIEHIRRIHKLSRKTYGSPRVHAQLRNVGRLFLTLNLGGPWRSTAIIQAGGNGFEPLLTVPETVQRAVFYHAIYVPSRVP
jgi:hypothetical protein